MKVSSVLEQSVIDEWRELGFYYDIDYKANNKRWRFYGSGCGLQKFVLLLNKYIRNPFNNVLSEHTHYGPYGYLKIMTWNEPVITENYIAGTLENLQKLGNLIRKKLADVKPGETFDIDTEYGIHNTATARFYIMEDDFDPPMIEALIIAEQAK